MRVADLSVVAAFLALIAIPFVFGSFAAYQLGLFLIYGIVTQSIALCWGRLGFLPLGQAVFFGAGAYLGGGSLIFADGNWWQLAPLLIGSALAPALFAGIIGYLVFRRQTGSGPFFSLITLAISMLAYQVVMMSTDLTGGFSGLGSIPSIPGLDPWGNFYWLILGVLFLSTVVIICLFRAPLGLIWSAISQNEERLVYLGYGTAFHKAFAFGISGFIAAIAGILFAAQQGIVTPETVGYLLSGELLIWAAVGGRASVMGPVFGAIFVGFLSDRLRYSFEYWEIVMALVFLAVVLKAPLGIAGFISPIWDRLQKPKSVPRATHIALPTGERTPKLEFENLRVEMGPVKILQGLSFNLRTSGLHCLIGPNGAGKTSVFNTITGNLPIRGGRVSWQTQAINGRLAHRVARLGIARKLQVPSVFPDLTIGEHIDIAMWSGNLKPWQALSRTPFTWTNDIHQKLCELFPFLQDEQRVAGELSLGHRQMLEFAMAIINKPTLVLLDEPCAGLSTDETRHMTHAIKTIATQFGISVLVIEHDFSVVEEMSDHVFVLHQGQLLAEGSLDDIKSNASVQAVYSGGVK